jgi:hypothetical protein
VETDEKVAGVDKEKRILPVSGESPAHIKEPQKREGGRRGVIRMLSVGVGGAARHVRFVGLRFGVSWRTGAGP